MQPKLSICIPTYNRADALKVLLESIYTQPFDLNQIEVCISDNASKDHIVDVVQSYQSQYENIVFYQSPENRGFDHNCLKAVEIAHGEYCWLMGSDDLIESGAIQTVLTELDSYKNLSGISVNVKGYSNDLSHAVYMRQIFNSKVSNYYFEDADEIFKKLVTQFGFMSAHIIRKQFWDEVIDTQDVQSYCIGYIHLFMIGSIILNHPCWLYLNTPCVGYRVDNDLTALSNRYQRLVVDITNYELIAQALFQYGTKRYWQWMRIICGVHVRSDILAIKFHATAKDVWRAFRFSFKHCWRMLAYWIHVMPYFLVPTFILRWIKKLYQHTMRRNFLSSTNNE